MFFSGDPVKVIDQIDPEKLKELHSVIRNKFDNKWVKRTFKLMDTAYVLKAVSPTNFDGLDEESTTELKKILLPWIEPYVGPNESIYYLDISSVPPETKIKAHLDYAFFQTVCRRIHIPVLTNNKSALSLWTDNGVKTYNLKVGKVYEINNQVVHVAGNLGDTERWHILADIIDNDVLEVMKKTGMLSSWAYHPSINFFLNDKIVNALDNALHTITEDI